MANMYCGAIDWTFDMLCEDVENAKALPLRRGVHLRKDASYREYFATWLKTKAKFFREDFIAKYGCEYDYGWVGDYFAEYLDECNVSDFYKDAYNQRPHFDRKLFAKICGLPTSLDVACDFCESVPYVERMKQRAAENREILESRAI